MSKNVDVEPATVKATLDIDPCDVEHLKQWLARRPDARTLRPITLKAVMIGSDAIFRLGEALKIAGATGTDALLVIDPTPMKRDSEDLKSLVMEILRRTGFAARVVSLPVDGYGRVQADFDNVQRVKSALVSSTAVVALGPGTIADVSKQACFEWEQEGGGHVPLVVCQTANTVTAYSASMAVLERGGVKHTWPSRYPDVLISDLQTLANAPRRLSVAGLGDCCPIFVSYADWYLAHLLGFEPLYTEAPLDLFHNLDKIFLESAEDVGKGTLKGAESLAKVIVLAGIAQSIVGMSRPFSGLEHVVLHLLDDVVAPHTGRSLPLHGAQAGAATLLAAAAYEEFLDNLNLAKFHRNSLLIDEHSARRRLISTFAPFDPSGALADAFWAEYETKVTIWNRNQDRVRDFLADWDSGETRRKVKSLVRPTRTVAEILRKADAPLTLEDLQPPIPIDEYRFAFINAPFTRQRFTLLDLLHFLGLLDEQFFNATLNRVRETISLDQTGPDIYHPGQ